MSAVTETQCSSLLTSLIKTKKATLLVWQLPNHLTLRKTQLYILHNEFDEDPKYITHLFPHNKQCVHAYVHRHNPQGTSGVKSHPVGKQKQTILNCC